MKNLFENKFYLHKDSSVFRAQGKDAERYLQARLSNNIKELSAGDHFLAACLTPQGKTEGLYIVYKESAESFLLLATGGDAEQLLSGLKRFLVADQVTIEKIENEKIAYVPSSYADKINANPAILIKNLCFNASLSAIILEESKIKSFTSPELQALNDDEYLFYQLSNRQLEFPNQVKPDSLFVECGILDATSSTKGCYAGQEVVERVISLGKLPAKILTYSFQSEENYQLEDAVIVDSEKAKAGEIINFASLANQTEQLLIARVKHAFLEKDLLLSIKDETIALKIS